jgi:membrane fusion protein, multidrug efflux system
VKRNAATPIQLEQIVTDYDATRKKLEATKRQKKAALSGVDEVSYRRMNTEAAIQRATAALEMARLNLSYTVVIAPCDGKLGRRSLEEGQFISAGQTITYILPDTQKWIVANYKETQIENLHIGQEVFVTVDAISDKEFKGKVTSISGATGSKYSLVPTDNSAGNFVKIQQRIPVRIDFTDLSKEDNERLAAGMMVVVKARL